MENEIAEIAAALKYSPKQEDVEGNDDGDNSEPEDRVETTESGAGAVKL